MSKPPSNPFANITPPAAGDIGAPSGAPSGTSSGGPAGGPGGAGGGQRAAINRFTPMAFHGTAMQLFGIQALNLLLTIVTLGIWIPWARVRRRRFFYTNTEILGESVDYLATGGTLFKGWMIVALVFTLYSFVPLLGVPFLEQGLGLLLVLLYPWIINRSLRFNARLIAWRDVRFDFTGSYFASLWYLFLLPIIAILPLGLLIPVASRFMRAYIARSYCFGSAKFKSDAGLGAYYGAGFKTLILFALGLAIIAGVGYAVVMTDGALANAVMMPGEGDAFFYALTDSPLGIGAMISLFILFIVVTTYYMALTRNIMVSALTLQSGVKFHSTLSGGVLAWIMLSNAVLIIISLGLLWPWAQVRKYRYFTESTEIRPINDMKGFIDKQLKSGSSVGDALGEATGAGIEF